MLALLQIRDVVQRTEGQGEVGCIKIGKNELEGMLEARGLMRWGGLKNSIRHKR